MEERHSGEHEAWITSDSVMVWHGIGMVFAWPLFIALGSLVGHYFKPPNNRWFSWFTMHVTLQILGLVQSVFWVGLIVVHVQMGGGFTSHLDGFHPIMGSILFLASLVQPIFGFIAHRVYLTTGGTSIYHTIHKWLGRGILLWALVTFTLGLVRITSKVVKNDGWLWALYVSLIGICAATIAYFEAKRFFEKRQEEEGQSGNRIELLEEERMEKEEEEEEEGEGTTERNEPRELGSLNGMQDIWKESSSSVPPGSRFRLDDFVLFAFAGAVLLIAILMAVDLYTQRADHPHEEMR